MRKFLLFIILVMSININAQIQRNLYGQTLGQSNLNDLSQTANSKGVNIIRETDNAFTLKKITFANYTWDDVIFKYYNSRLQSVLFIKTVDNREQLNKDYLFEIFKNLDESLYNKYVKYFNERDDKYFPYVKYSDEKTTITIKLIEMKDLKRDELWLEYIDKELSELEAEGSDEL